MTQAKAIENRYEFVYLFDVENGNPNGDPDAGNLPRTDPGTGHGYVTDVCLKRKIRNYVDIVKENQAPYEIFVREGAILNDQQEKAHVAVGVEKREDEGEGKKKRKGKGDEVKEARRWMCENFFDVRTFGAVMTTGTNCGQVRGPVQINFARSTDPVLPMDITVTRMAVTTKAKSEKQGGENRTMGRKQFVPYALYRAEGYISAFQAGDTGFSEGDLKLLWEALKNMFEHDRSAARGKMAARNLIVFKHASKLGNAPAHELFNLVRIEKNTEEGPSRCYNDYKINISEDIPEGIEITEII